MNRKKKLLRVIAAVICLVLIMGVNVGISAADTESNFEMVSDAYELESAIKRADEGDEIILLHEITISNDLPVPDGKITITRLDPNSRLITRNGVRVDFQNMIFDGAWMDNQYYSFITLQGDFSFKNCTFQNCGDPERTGGGNRIGGAVRVEAGEGTFENCTFIDNNAVAGGHLAVRGDSIVHLNQCTMKNGVALGEGGAVEVYGSSKCYIDSCVITENRAGNYGGGIANRAYAQVSNSKIYNNITPYGGADIGNGIGGTIDLQDSVERLNELFAEDNIIVHGWVCDYDFEQGIFIPDVDPAAENALLKLDYEYKQPEPEIPEETEPTEPEPTEPEEQEPTEPAESEEQPTETEEPDELQPEQPTEEEPDTETEAPDDENPNEEDPTTPATPSEPSVNNNSTTTTTNSNSSTDNSDRSTHSTTTDNSRRTETNDSNNTSTINNYYAQEQQPSSGGESVQTIVVPAGNSGSGEPIEQTIRVEAPDGSTGADGMTLNINVNVGEDGTTDQEAEASPQQQDGASWYQVAVLCLLSAILVCVIKKR